MKYYTLLFIVFLAFFSCQSKEESTEIDPDAIPELVIVDSLVIDRLTLPNLLDVKPDHSEFLFYDWKTSEFLIISKSGEILITADLAKDGKNSMDAGYFLAAKFGVDDEVLVHTVSGIYTYDSEFNLKNKKKNDFELSTRTIGGSKAFETIGNYLFTFSVEEMDRQALMEADYYSIAYPFITIRDMDDFVIINRDTIPEESRMAKEPGFYMSMEPTVKLHEGKLFMLYPYSPEIYVYDIPSLKLIDSWSLTLGENFKEAEPSETKDPTAYISIMKASPYVDFVFSNDYMLAAYKNGIPADELAKITMENIGSEESGVIIRKFRFNNNYQVYKGKKLLWEGDWGVRLSSFRDLIFASYKPGEDPNAVEKDVQTLYFYELK
jgi:hypothetical protein